MWVEEPFGPPLKRLVHFLHDQDEGVSNGLLTGVSINADAECWTLPNSQMTGKFTKVYQE